MRFFHYLTPIKILIISVVEPGQKAYENAIKRSKENDSIRCINDYFENSLDILKMQDYDFITSTGVLHETETPELFLKNIGKLSNMKTIIYLNVPNAMSLHRLIAQEAGIIKNVYEKSDRNKLLSQNNIFCKDSLKELITKTLPEFKIQKCESFFIKPLTHNQMMKCVDQKIVNEKVLDGLYEATKYLPELGCELYCTISKL